MAKTTKQKSANKVIIEENYSGTYINPLTDFGFKRLFGTESNKDLLIHFLNSVLKIDGEIIDLQHCNVEQKGRIKTDRKALFDLLCTTNKGEFIIVEMQNMPQKYFKDRAVYYITFPVQQQGEKKKRWNYKLNPIYSINILNFSLEESNDDELQYYHKVMLMDISRNKVFYEKLIFLFLELPDFSKSEEKIETFMDWWYFILKNLPMLDKLPDALEKNKIFKKLFYQAELANMTKEELNKYDKSLKNYRDMYTVKHIVRDFQRENVLLKKQYTGLEKQYTGLEKQYTGLEKHNADLVKQNENLLQEINKLRNN